MDKLLLLYHAGIIYNMRHAAVGRDLAMFYWWLILDLKL